MSTKLTHLFFLFSSVPIMYLFIEIEKRFKSFDINKVLEEVWKNPIVEQFIVALITEGNSNSQLYNQGIDGDGDSLGDYTDFTIQMKSSRPVNQKEDINMMRRMSKNYGPNQ